MDGYNHDPYRYHHHHHHGGPPLRPDYDSGHPPAYPPPPYGPSGSFSAYPAAPPYQSPFGHYDNYYSSPHPTPTYPPPPHHSSYPSFASQPYPPPSAPPNYPPYGSQPPPQDYDHAELHPPPPPYPTTAPTAPTVPYLETSLSNISISDHHPPRPLPSYQSPPASFASCPSLQIVPAGGSQKLEHSKSSTRVLLLHGNLEIWVHCARNLPNMDTFSNTLQGVIGKASKITSDPYVTFSGDYGVLGRTYVVSNSEDPIWNQHFYIPIAHRTPGITFSVKDDDFVGSELMGTVTIPAQQIHGGQKVKGTYPILSANGKPCKAGASLTLSIQYYSVDSLRMYHVGVEPGPEYVGVLGTYFPLHKGGRVTLYQDAHVPDGCLPDVWRDDGMRYEHGKCWRDICKAISEARRLIYITGWSVYHDVHLVRDDPSCSELTLGELLKRKSQEGVRVLLLIWDDPTSRSILGYNRAGLMDTNDEVTRKFFKHSSVHILLCPRSAGKKHSWVKQREAGLIYTHHQKSVILDSDAGNNRRKLTAFVGGLDLCKGRYDTPKHPLFSTLETVHKDDYHNPNFTVSSGGGPREPWHDLHSRIDGPAAYDVLQNFEERWRKASKPSTLNKMLMKQHFNDALLKLDRIAEILGINESHCSNDNDPETWHVQIFRSIDSNSVKGFPKDPIEVSRKNLVCGKNVRIDMSIHTAYVKAIRSAQHFIYIENQYFLGSSYNWSSNRNIGADNLIPMEIALKIADKIKAKERFSVYVVIPMWPEGDPTGAPTQRILFWQNKTMQMMYQTIYDALLEAGLENEYTPQDYLNFFCLGNREVGDGNIAPSKNVSNANTPSGLAQKNRRFMIYVHSKGMIVDDEYVIMGSANINQRSLEGTRDTEIAMGTYQPHHVWARKPSGPRGQVHCYRMSLWAEHLGIVEECFARPESLECIRRVRMLGEYNWQRFASDDVSVMPGHLLKYPVDVDSRGYVKPLPGCGTFPDIGGNICGSFLLIEENLTI